MLVAQSCPTLCDPVDCSPPGSCIHGIFQEEHCSGLPFPSLGDLPDPGIKPGSPALHADSLPFAPPGKKEEITCGINLIVSFKIFSYLLIMSRISEKIRKEWKII